MSSSRKPSRKRGITLCTGSDSESSNHDPYSDGDGEFGSDGNYEPVNNISSSSSENIFDVLPRFPRERLKSETDSDQSDVSNDNNRPDFEETRTQGDDEIFESLEREVRIGVNEEEDWINQIGSRASLLEEDVTEEDRTLIAGEGRDWEAQEGDQRTVQEGQNEEQVIQEAGDQERQAQEREVEEREGRNRNPSRIPTRRGRSTPPPVSDVWEESYGGIPEFEFISPGVGPTFQINENTSVSEVFDAVISTELVDYMVNQTNAYGAALTNVNRPHTRHARHSTFRPTDHEEFRKFLGLSLLGGQIDVPLKRKLLTHDDPLYYHPVFHYTMSGRRYEQILRCLYAAELDSKGSAKIDGFMNHLTQNFRNMFNPAKELSLDESLLLFRGRLVFRQYIKSKKARYGIKFYVLTTADGYVLNIKMYSGSEDVDGNQSKIDKLVLKLMDPYLLKGHELYMDNYYNSVRLSEKLITLKTHSNGTLRKVRKDNPSVVVKKKLVKGQHVWARKGKVYVSGWRDKRDVYMLTTLDYPALIEVTNRHGKKRIKPAEVNRYNQYMSGVDRSNQMVSYYSSPRKTIRWYKKVIFHLLDVSVWNAFYIYKKYVKKTTNMSLLHFEKN